MNSLFREWWRGGGAEWSKDVVREGPTQVEDAAAFGFGAGVAAAAAAAADGVRIAELLQEAVVTDGGHHKQWYLEQIAKGLKVPLPDHKEGIAP